MFCTCADGALPNGAEPLASFREREGLTLVLERRQAERLGLPYEYVAAWITLTVHSSLAAVGLTAAFATALAEAGISCNVMAGYFHDHLFVARDEGAPSPCSSGWRRRHTDMWQSYLNGILVAAGLIIAIGAQNAFVLAQSLRREHHLSVAALCVFCDAVLVSLGVFGLAKLLLENPTLLAIARWGGIAFLTWYGLKALLRALRPDALGNAAETGHARARRCFWRHWRSPCSTPRLSRYRTSDRFARRPAGRAGPMPSARPAPR